MGVNRRGFYLGFLDDSYADFHTAKAHPSVSRFLLVQPLAASSAFLSYKRQVSGPCFGTLGRDISPSAPKPCVGALFCSGLFISRLPRAVFPGRDRLVAARDSKPYHLFLSSALQFTVCPLIDFYQEWWHCSMLMEGMFE